jgi:RimJ/RimL family protein N-acetyltransferase
MTEDTTVAGGAPVIRTERLVLRAHRADDLAAMEALWRDADVTRYIGGRPATRDEVWQRMLRYAGHWALRGFGYWAIEEQASGRLVGDVGVADWKRGITGYDDLPEAGWALHPDVHGRGYGGEALAAALAWADRRFGAVPIFAIIAPENIASIRLAARHDFRFAEDRVYRDHTVGIHLRQPTG